MQHDHTHGAHLIFMVMIFIAMFAVAFAVQTHDHDDASTTGCPEDTIIIWNGATDRTKGAR